MMSYQGSYQGAPWSYDALPIKQNRFAKDDKELPARSPGGPLDQGQPQCYQGEV